MQRAMIVDAICAEPSVLIADNITQPLDVTIGAQIVALLHDLCLRHKMATIYLSSSLATLGQFGLKTAILHQGRLVEQQAFPDLIASPRSDYAKRAIASVPRIWSTNEGPVSRRKAEDAPLMRIENAHRTYRVRKRGTFNTFNRIQAVRGVSVDIMPRENFGIVGESGCGKSTLTRLIAWLEAPDQGEIILNGVSLRGLSARQLIAKRNEFQLLLQDPYNALPPRTTVGRMIEESLRIRGGAKGYARARDRRNGGGRPVARSLRRTAQCAVDRRAPAHLHRARPDPRSQAADPRRDALVARSARAVQADRSVLRRCRRRTISPMSSSLTISPWCGKSARGSR